MIPEGGQEKLQSLVQKCVETSGDINSAQQVLVGIEQMGKCLKEANSGSQTSNDFAYGVAQLQQTGDSSYLVDGIKDDCKKKSLYFGCIHQFFDAISPCFSYQEQATKDTLMRISKRLIAFMCDNDSKYVAG